MKIHTSLFIALAANAAVCAAQSTDRTISPVDRNPACMDRNVDSNSPGCLNTTEPGAAARVVAPLGSQQAQPAAGEFPVTPGLKPAPILPPVGQQPLTPTNPTLPPVGQQPLTPANPTLPPIGQTPLAPTNPTLSPAGSASTTRSTGASSTGGAGGPSTGTGAAAGGASGGGAGAGGGGGGGRR